MQVTRHCFRLPVLPQINSLVVTELPVGHVPVVTDDLADVFWRHVLFLGVHEAKLSLLRIALCLQLLPFAGWERN